MPRPHPEAAAASTNRTPAASAQAAPINYSPAAVERRIEAQAHFATGFLQDLNDRPQAAAAEYLQAGLRDLDNEPLILDIVRRLLHFKATDQAVQLLTQATARPRASGALFAQLGLVYSLAGKKEEAIQANRLAIKKSPDELAGYRHLAQIYFQAGQPEAGLAVLDEAAQRPDPDAMFLTELGEFYLAFARTGPTDAAKARAQAVFDRAAEQSPKHPLILQKLADGFVFLGKTERGIELYQKLLDQLPHLPGVREKLANLYLRNKDYTNAATQLDIIVRDNPTDSRAYYLLGSMAYDNKDMERAAECFRKVKLLNPKFEPAYYELAGAQINLNQATNALDTLEAAREQFQPNFVCEFYTGLAYGRLKDYAASVKHFVAAEVIARATDTNRLNHLFYFQLGAAYERNQQIEEAVASFRKSLALEPKFGEALNYLGYLWADRGENLEEARTLIQQAVDLEPKNAAYLDSLGWVLFRLKQPAAALPYLLKAIEYSEAPDATLQDHLGDVYHALQQPDQARRAWQKSLTIEPNEHKAAIQKKLDALKPARGTLSSSGSD